MLVIAVLSSVCALALLRHHGYDASRLVVAGDRFVDPTAAPAGLFVFPQSAGYDGQFVYRLSIDPFTTERVAHGIALDNPPYRQKRLLVPLLVWAITLG